MKSFAQLAILFGFMSIIVGMVARSTLTSMPLVAGTGLGPGEFMTFARTCFLFAIAIMMYETVKDKN